MLLRRWTSQHEDEEAPAPSSGYRKLHSRDGSDLWGGRPLHMALLVGERGAGKTAIMSRCRESLAVPSSSQQPSNAVDFASREVRVGGREAVIQVGGDALKKFTFKFSS